MYIKELELINWQKHSSLKFNFNEGVNIIHGSSDAGKSCIRRAIAWVFDLESYNEETIRKEGTKKTSIRVVLNNGVEIERVRSSSINRFITRVNGKESEYDAVGKGAPQEVKDLLKVSLVEIDDKNKLNLNIAEQVALPFLQDIPGSVRLKLFNKLCGNDLIDLVIGNFNKEILSINKDIKYVKETIETNAPQVGKLTDEISKREIIKKEISVRIEEINREIQKYNKLKELQVKLQENRKNLEVVENSIKSLKFCDEKTIHNLKNDINVFSIINKLKTGLFSCKEQLEHTNDQLSKIKVPEVNSDQIRIQIKRFNHLNDVFKGIIDKLGELNTINKKLEEVKTPEINILTLRTKIEKTQQLTALIYKGSEYAGKTCVITNDLNEVNKLIPEQEKEYNSLIKEVGICPVCKQDTSKCEVHL